MIPCSSEIPDIRAQKAALRRQIRAERRALEPEMRRAWDASIQAQVLALPAYRQARTVFCFIACGGEPETRGILRDVLAAGKRLAVPRCLSDGIMEAVCIDGPGGLAPGMYGIPAPREDLPAISFDEIDFALVPALAYTAAGDRLGQGGGYYDRFMEKTKAFTCGVCYRRFLLDSVPVEPFDRRVGLVICE
ncbi:MAG: 5-formyltetrahydrofolate cyclo-ligase [Butyricicoccaceae bacterium]